MGINKRKKTHFLPRKKVSFKKKERKQAFDQEKMKENLLADDQIKKETKL